MDKIHNINGSNTSSSSASAHEGEKKERSQEDYKTEVLSMLMFGPIPKPFLLQRQPMINNISRLAALPSCLKKTGPQDTTAKAINDTRNAHFGDEPLIMSKDFRAGVDKAVQISDETTRMTPHIITLSIKNFPHKLIGMLAQVKPSPELKGFADAYQAIIGDSTDEGEISMKCNRADEVLLDVMTNGLPAGIVKELEDNIAATKPYLSRGERFRKALTDQPTKVSFHANDLRSNPLLQILQKQSERRLSNLTVQPLVKGNQAHRFVSAHASNKYADRNNYYPVAVVNTTTNTTKLALLATKNHLITLSTDPGSKRIVLEKESYNNLAMVTPGPKITHDSDYLQNLALDLISDSNFNPHGTREVQTEYASHPENGYSDHLYMKRVSGAGDELKARIDRHRDKVIARANKRLLAKHAPLTTQPSNEEKGSVSVNEAKNED